ncbi:MAG: PF20097 family protein [Peptococcales bacterium]
MNCPYCNEEMEKGFLHASSSAGMYWLKEGDSIILNTAKSIKKNNGILLCKPSMFGPAKSMAYICKQCQKIIIDFH